MHVQLKPHETIQEETCIQTVCPATTLNFAIDYERALMQLSDTDLWVWLMYRRGYTQEWIGERLGVSQSDIAYHLGQIVSELGRRLHDDPVH